MSFRYLVCIGLALTLALAEKGHATTITAHDYLRKGYIASTARQWNNAIALYSKAIELNPSDAEAYMQRAINLEMEDRTDEAIADYEKAVQMQPNYYLALEYLARLYESKGQYEKAFNCYGRALALVKDPTWRSMVTWWMSEARKKISTAEKRGSNQPVGATSR
jgi:tetratricopeptide (TPR) repeat protein